MFKECLSGYYAEIVLLSYQALGWKSKKEFNAFDLQMKHPFMKQMTSLF